MKPINSVGSQPNQNPYQNKANSIKDKAHETLNKNDFFQPIDTFTKSVDGAANPAEIRKLWAETDYMGNAIRTLVQSAIGNTSGTGQGFWVNRSVNLNLSEADRLKAQELISEDGYFGVTQTTDRIMGFAKALVGEGASEQQIENMRAAVQKGFDEVAKLFGGFDKLPQVTKDTYDAIMKEFEQWLPASVNLEKVI